MGQCQFIRLFNAFIKTAESHGHAVDMWILCSYVRQMGGIISIRNVPQALHRRLKYQAALAGMSLSEYLLSEIDQGAKKPTIEELRKRLNSRKKTVLSVSTAEAVRAERDRGLRLNQRVSTGKQQVPLRE